MRSASGLAMRIVVLGAGNTLLSDEGLGVRVIERLPLRYSLPPEVGIIDAGTCGMEMLDDLEDLDALIMVDAIRAGKAPGTLIRLTAEAVPVFFRTKLSPHQIGPVSYTHLDVYKRQVKNVDPPQQYPRIVEEKGIGATMGSAAVLAAVGGVAAGGGAMVARNLGLSYKAEEAEKARAASEKTEV